METVTLSGNRLKRTQYVPFDFALITDGADSATPVPHTVYVWTLSNLPEARLEFTVSPANASAVISFATPAVVSSYNITPDWGIDVEPDHELYGRTIVSTSPSANTLTLDQAITYTEALTVALVRPVSDADILRFIADYSLSDMLLTITPRFENYLPAELNAATNGINYNEPRWRTIRRGPAVSVDLDAFLTAAGMERTDTPITFTP